MKEGDLLLVDDVEENFIKMLKKDMCQPLYFDFDKGNRLEYFVHHREYMVNKRVDYQVKKRICSKMGAHREKFKFKNQSVTSLANSILKLHYGEIMKSVHNVDCLKIVDRFKPDAVVRNFYLSHSHREHQKEVCEVTGLDSAEIGNIFLYQ